MRIGQVLDAAAAAAPRQVAVSLGERWLTFGQVDEAANRTANALVGLGIARGDTVAWWADTSLAGVALRFATARLGAVFAPLNPAYGLDEATASAEYLGSRLLVADAGHLDAAGELAERLGLDLAVLDDGDPGVPDPVADLGRAAAGASAARPTGTPPDPADTDAVFLTSGSTGRPKGVLLSQRTSWLRALAGITSSVARGGPGEVGMFPLFHMAGWHFLEQAWSAGRPFHLVERAEAGRLLGAVERWRASSLYCIPAVWDRILAEGAGADASSLRWTFTGTSLVTTELLSALKDRFPQTRTTVNYGSTEAGRSLALGDADLFAKPGSVGLPVPGTLARLDGSGELLIANEWLMTGYLDLPDETAAVLEDGWYRTGDLAERDDDGYFTIVGRRREIIRTGGETVAPVEVEAALLDFPGLADVAVAGVPDVRFGEIVCAFVVPAPGRPAPTVEELRAHVGGRLAPFKHPRRVVVTDRLPRTGATGQIQRSALADAAR
ncbi:MAG TPA: class I adenylate-forming enzyme family protein [Acidimicrobiales bacterium]|nr:class I adenylate-forming enzyme family protein [Acidimicrobiales bacterium]